jgi:hypothetical protein
LSQISTRLFKSSIQFIGIIFHIYSMITISSLLYSLYKLYFVFVLYNIAFSSHIRWHFHFDIFCTNIWFSQWPVEYWGFSIILGVFLLIFLRPLLSVRSIYSTSEELMLFSWELDSFQSTVGPSLCSPAIAHNIYWISKPVSWLNFSKYSTNPHFSAAVV